MNDLLLPGAGPIGSPAPAPDGPLVLFARVLEKAPSFLFHFLLGLLEACLSDTVTTALMIASIALALAFGPAVGVAAFFFVYVICRVVGNIAAALGAVAGATGQSANAFGAMAGQMARFHEPPQT